MVSACAQSFTPPFATALPQATPPKREQCAIIPLSIVRAMFGNITRSGILVYCALAAHADQEGHCWPGRARLGEITGLTERQISRATAELEKKGLLRKEYRANGMVDYYLLPVSPETPPPVTAVTPPLSPLSPITNQGTTQKEQREATPDPGVAAAPPEVVLSQASLRTPKTEAPDSLPAEWLDSAQLLRPDLSIETIRASAEVFLDHNRSKGIMLVDWLPAWRNWVRREKAPKTAPQARQAPQPASRYETPDAKEKPLSAAVRAALELGEERRIEQLLAAGIDPATGNRIVQPTVATATQPPMAAAPSQPPIFVQQFTRAQQERIIELAAGGMSLAEAKRRVAGGEGRG